MVAWCTAGYVPMIQDDDLSPCINALLQCLPLIWLILFHAQRLPTVLSIRPTLPRVRVPTSLLLRGCVGICPLLRMIIAAADDHPLQGAAVLASLMDSGGWLLCSIIRASENSRGVRMSYHRVGFWIASLIVTAKSMESSILVDLRHSSFNDDLELIVLSLQFLLIAYLLLDEYLTFRRSAQRDADFLGADAVLSINHQTTISSDLLPRLRPLEQVKPRSSNDLWISSSRASGNMPSENGLVTPVSIPSRFPSAVSTGYKEPDSEDLWANLLDQNESDQQRQELLSKSFSLQEDGYIAPNTSFVYGVDKTNNTTMDVHSEEYLALQGLTVSVKTYSLLESGVGQKVRQTLQFDVEVFPEELTINSDIKSYIVVKSYNEFRAMHRHLQDLYRYQSDPESKVTIPDFPVQPKLKGMEASLSLQNTCHEIEHYLRQLLMMNQLYLELSSFLDVIAQIKRAKNAPRMLPSFGDTPKPSGFSPVDGASMFPDAKDNTVFKVAPQIDQVKEEMQADTDLLKSRRKPLHLYSYKACATGKQLVNWLLESGYATSREDAGKLCQQLMDVHGLTHWSKGQVVFEDSDAFYQFKQLSGDNDVRRSSTTGSILSLSGSLVEDGELVMDLDDKKKINDYNQSSVRKFDSIAKSDSKTRDPFVRVQLFDNTQLSHITLRCPRSTTVGLLKDCVMENMAAKRIQEVVSLTNSDLAFTLNSHSSNSQDFLQSESLITSHFDVGVTVMVVYCNLLEESVGRLSRTGSLTEQPVLAVPSSPVQAYTSNTRKGRKKKRGSRNK